MIKQKQLRIAEIIIAVALFASVWLRIIQHPMAKPLLLIFTAFTCILYVFYNHVFFLDEESKWIPEKGAMKKKYGEKTSMYSTVAACVCCLIALFGTQMILFPKPNSFKAVFVLGIAIPGFLLYGIIHRKDKIVLNALLDGLRSMIIITIPYAFYFMMMWPTLTVAKQ